MALGLLIIFHTLLVFQPGGWRITSIHAGRWAILLAATFSPWRLEIIFAIGGIAAAFLLKKQTPLGFIRLRVRRILIPFVFALVVLVPPQDYVGLLYNNQPTAGFLNFWLGGHWIRFKDDLPMPDLAHVWFLPYLFFYSAVLAFLLAKKPALLDRARKFVESKSIWVIVAASMGWYALIQSIYSPFPDLWKFILADIPAHLLYAPAFFFGFLIADSDHFWNALAEARRTIWIIALIAMAASLVLLRVSELSPSPAMILAATVSRGLFGGIMFFAVFAWGRWACSTPAPGLAYATDAILPVYLMHQTVLVVGAYALGATRWPAPLALPFLVLMSFGVPLLLYHFIIRHISWLRVLFGLRVTHSGTTSGWIRGMPSPGT